MKQVKILSTTDVHGYLDKGLAELPTLKERLKPNLLIDCGDFLVGSSFATFGFLNDGLSPLVTVANELAYDVMIPGNHDLDYGLAWLKEQVSALDAAYVCANLVDRENQLIFDPFVIIEKNSVKIAVIGLMTHGLSQLLPDAVVSQVKTRSPQVVLTELLPQVAEIADIVIVAYHGGLTRDPVDGKTWHYPSLEDQAYDLIAKFPEINSLICGHQHFKNTAINAEHGTAVIQPGAFGQVAGYQIIELSNEGKKVQVLENQLLSLASQRNYTNLLEKDYQAWLSSTVNSAQLIQYIERIFEADIYLLDYQAKTVGELSQEMMVAFPVSEHWLKGKELLEIIPFLSQTCSLSYTDDNPLEDESIYKVLATPQLIADSYLRKNFLVPLFSDFMTRDN